MRWGDEKEQGFAGHALALTQAGSYMHRHHVSFSWFVKFYSKKQRESAVKDVFRYVSLKMSYDIFDEYLQTT